MKMKKLLLAMLLVPMLCGCGTLKIKEDQKGANASSATTSNTTVDTGGNTIGPSQLHNTVHILPPVSFTSPTSNVITIGGKTFTGAPLKSGCYRHTSGASTWEEVPCLSKDELSHVPPGAGNPALYESQQAGPWVTPGQAEMDVTNVNFGGVNDSKYGSGDFSLQLNSNAFPGANGQQYVVQFLQQNFTYNGQQQHVLCIENVNSTTQNYGFSNGDTSCVNVPYFRGPATGDTGSIVAYANGGVLSVTVALPWSQTSGGTVADAYSISSPDVYNLEAPGAWHYIDGGMLGGGAGSNATFTKSCQSTKLSLWFNGLPNNSLALLSGEGNVTVESNNLQTVNIPFGGCSAQGQDGTCTATFDQVSKDWLSQGQPTCYPQDTPPPKLSPTKQGAFEDDASRMTLNGRSIHVCPDGALLIGVDAANNRFLCSNTFLLSDPLPSELMVDTSTHSTFTYGSTSHSIHVCPTNNAMVGWDETDDSLVCRPLPPSGDVPVTNFGNQRVDGPSNIRQVPEPNHTSINMHTCNRNGDGGPDAMRGIQAGDNVLVCMNSQVTARLQ